MQVKAIYEDGMINLAQPLQFKHRKFEVIVSIPEDELEPGKVELPEAELIMGATQPEAIKKPAIRQQLDAILGSYKDQLKSGNPLAAQDCKNIWHEHLEEKYLGRR